MKTTVNNSQLESRERRIATLNAAANAKKIKNEKNIRDAIDKLTRSRQPISLSAVAREAGVSRQTIYNSGFLKEIQELSRRTPILQKRISNPSFTTEASLIKRLSLLQDELKSTKEELKLAKLRIQSLLTEQIG